MNKLQTLLLAFLTLFLSFTANYINAASAPIPVNADISQTYGKTYAEWSLAWVQWATSIPGTTNPINDTTGEFAAIGQAGDVWFLAGSAGQTVTRNITVPANKALFFPIINTYWVNTPEYGDNPWSPTQEAFVRDYLSSAQDNARGLRLTIDGEAILNPNNYRVKSTVGKCSLPPKDNLFGVKLKGIPHDCLADGYWVFLSPLPAGQHHTISFQGTVGTGKGKFSLDITYEINILP